jgi:PhnB protein
MTERSIIDLLDNAITALLARRDFALAEVDQELAELVEVARGLTDLPSDEFRTRLKAQLEGRTSMSTPAKQFETAPFRTLTPYLCFANAAAAIDFYKKAFGATELMRLTEPGGKIGHAELQIGNSIFKLSDEYPEYDALSPSTLGGSPVKMHLYVSNVDEFVEHAIAEGAKLSRPIADQFYGDRTGQLKDPFGYSWTIATHKRDVSVDEMQKYVEAFAQTSLSKAQSKKYRREGFHTVTPYLTVEKAAELVDFVKEAFGATESFRGTGSAGGLHCEVKIGDSMVAIGGGPGIQGRPGAIHLYVSNPDEVYAKAVAAGATSLVEPVDQDYGERLAAVRDIGGNEWYIARRFDETPIPDLHAVNLYFHPRGAPKFIAFLEEAFGATVAERHQSPEGFVYHAKILVGDSIVEVGEAHGPWQPLATAVYLYVEDVDEIYEQALAAGATSALPPTDQSYGDRSAWVNDQFGHIWYLATLIGQ